MSAFDGDPVDGPGDDIVFDFMVGVFGNEDVGAVVLVEALGAAGEVDGVADDGVVEAGLAADVADDDFTGVNAAAGEEEGSTLGFPLFAEGGQAPLVEESGFTGR